MRHILSARQFSTEEIGQIFERADYMREKLEASEPIPSPMPNGKNAVAPIFYEPSTRTRLSFETAAHYLHLPPPSTENAKEYSSDVKGESLEDTIRTISKYAGVIVLRHNETGAMERAASVSEVPIINAGDGDGEHPTQALLDLYTIQKVQGRTEGLRVVIGGDLVKGRTARSLALLLSLYPGNSLTFVSLPELSMRDDIKQYLEETGTPFEETQDMHDAISQADVVYWTRLQLERHKKQTSFMHKLLASARVRKQELGLQHNYVIDQATLQIMQDDAMIMHPLPRNNEIDVSVDSDPRAKYFDQVENGLYIRMALLDELLSS